MTNHVLKHEGKLLQNILSKVGVLKQLNEQLTRHLDPELAKHCQIAKIDKDCLIVLVDSSNWATQLRFYIPDLLPKLRTYPPFQNLKAICSKVRPDYKPVSGRKQPRIIKHLSTESAQMVLETASTIEDKDLRAVLERIAKRFL